MVGIEGTSGSLTPTTHRAEVTEENQLVVLNRNTSGTASWIHIDGDVSTANSTMVPLGANGSWVGEWEEVKDSAIIYTAIRTDQDGRDTGQFSLHLDFSMDATTPEDVHEEYYIASGTYGAVYSVQPSARYFRPVYYNGATPQGIFRLQTQYRHVYGKPSSHRIDDPISDQNDAELTKSVMTGKTPGGTYVNFNATAGGNFKTSIEEYEPEFFLGSPLPVTNSALAISQGKFTGMSKVNKFGRNPDIDQDTKETIWSAGGLYKDVFLSGAENIYLRSSQAVDTSAGIGARTVAISGLDGDYVQQSETVTLNGLGSVETANEYLRLHRMYVSTVGVSGTNMGSIVANGSKNTQTIAQIDAENGQTEMAIYTIPSGTTGYMTNFYTSFDKGGAGATAALVDIEMQIRPSGGAYRVAHHAGMISTGMTHIQHNYNPYKSFGEKTDIMLNATPTVNDADIHGGFDLILVGNE